MRSEDGKETLLYKCLKIPVKIPLKMGLVSVNHQLKSDLWNMWLCMYHSISSTCLNVVQYRNSRELNVYVFSLRFLYCHRAWDKVGVGFKFRRGFSFFQDFRTSCLCLFAKGGIQGTSESEDDSSLPASCPPASFPILFHYQSQSAALFFLGTRVWILLK